MYVSKSLTFPTLHIGHSRHGLFFTRLDCQPNAKPCEKDHDLPEIGWLKKGEATPDRSRTPARGPLFGFNVLPQVKSAKSIKAEKDRIKKKDRKKTERTLIEES
jgi:hypothetical protein